MPRFIGTSTRLLAAAVVAAGLVTAVITPAAADGTDGTPTPAPTTDGSIGIRLLEAPVDRRNDPRARIYIVDHLNPGMTITRRIEISNKTSVRRTFRLYPGAAAIEQNAFVFDGKPTTNDLTGWTDVRPATVVLEPRQRGVALATISVPTDTLPGERYAVLWSESAAAAGPTQNVAGVSRVGIRVYLDIGRGAEPASDFAIDKLTAVRTDDGLPIVTARVRNTGGRAIDMNGSLALSNGPAGSTAGPFPVAAGTTLAPGGQGTVSANVDPALPEGTWTARLQLESGTARREITGRITFPEPGGISPAQLLRSVGPTTWYVGGAAIIALAVLAGGITLRRRSLRWRENAA